MTPGIAIPPGQRRDSLRPTVDGEPKALGRLQVVDQRDRDYPAAALRQGEPTDEEGQVAVDRGWRYWWAEGWWGDQGSLPHCVAFAALHALEDGPITWAPRAPGAGPVMDTGLLYREAQNRDEWPGSNYDGTSARGAAAYLLERGLITGYRWDWTMAAMAQTLLRVGPVMFGTWWFTGMDKPTAATDYVVRPTGTARGGHEVLANGINLHRGLVRFKNSWGRRWGKAGHFYMTIEDVAFLLERAGGDACVLVGEQAA